jgi:integrase
MSIFKRGKIYWFHFVFDGQHVQQSTKQGNPRVARQIEAAHRTALAKGEVGITVRKPIPILKDFAQRFIDAVQVRSAAKPRTVEFYAQQLARLLDFEPLASARLNEIDEAVVETFVQHRRKQVGAASVNRALATLRRLLRLAQEWRVLDRIPRVHLLPGERNRDFVLTHRQEAAYLDSAPQPLKDVVVLILDTGLRVGEALALRWSDVHLEPVGDARFGYLHVSEGKTRNARRNVSVTARVREMLAARQSGSMSKYVFANGKDAALWVSSLDHSHREVRRALKLPQDFVLHSLRHTFLTRLGTAGVEAFTIMRLAGHSSVTISQKYVHPTPQSMEEAMARLENLNKNALLEGSRTEKRRLPATVSATPAEAVAVSD